MYQVLDCELIHSYLKKYPYLEDKLGHPKQWQVREIGDGNLNLIFEVRGPLSSFLVKQALPYVRCVGESWPLSENRTFFEYSAYRTYEKWVPEFLPKIYFYDAELQALGMEYLEGHEILRKKMIRAEIQPDLGAKLGLFSAKSLFFTSDLYLTSSEKKSAMKIFCDNQGLCQLTEQVIFTDPFRIAPLNRWTSPQLDEIALRFRKQDIKAKVIELKQQFLCSAEALIHGDLHSGSVMVSESSYKVIDPEFAFYGPMAFDLGMFIANLAFSYCSQERSPSTLCTYRPWVLDQIKSYWNTFQKEFLGLWGTDLKGDLFSEIQSEQGTLSLAKKNYMDRLFENTLGFCAAELVRRILGVAHVADLDTIENLDLRVACETKALRLAEELFLHAGRYKNIEDFASALASFV